MHCFGVSGTELLWDCGRGGDRESLPRFLSVGLSLSLELDVDDVVVPALGGE